MLAWDRIKTIFLKIKKIVTDEKVVNKVDNKVENFKDFSKKVQEKEEKKNKLENKIELIQNDIVDLAVDDDFDKINKKIKKLEKLKAIYEKIN